MFDKLIEKLKQYRLISLILSFIDQIKPYRSYKIFNASKKLRVAKNTKGFKRGGRFINTESDKLTAIKAFLLRNWVVCYFILSIIYFELLFRVWSFKNLSLDFIFPVLFALSAGAAIGLVISIIPVKAANIASVAVSLLLVLVYGIQLVYFSIFHTPLSLISLGGAGDALQYRDIVVNGILSNAVAVVLLFVPLVIYFIRSCNLCFTAKKPFTLALTLLFCVSSYSAAIICISLTGDNPASQYSLYYKVAAPELSASKLGLLTTIRQDIGRLAASIISSDGNYQKNGDDFANGTDDPDDVAVNQGSTTSGTAGGKVTDPSGGKGSPGTIGEGNNDGTAETGQAGNSTESEATDPIQMKPFNTMDIDFDKLLTAGKSDSNYDMHKYFSSVQPTPTNKYTGMFKGHNLILLTAEAFSPYAISPELTPTLYKMSTEGFVFKNFYNPVWWVSTSDGEYVACTGLIPKGGVWSFAKSGENSMPFTLGNQFRKLGYTTKAYHNHTYTYYKRDISHPNMGYEYKGLGNGLEVKKTWPESDLEMINVTVDEYIGKQPFHTYYMTVSGHMNYSFSGNSMASKNREYVKDLPYSDPCKAYIACNLELEFAMKALLDRLEEAGIAENTVIALSADHYPYGLAKENLDELAGHEVEKNFELYKSTFILWKKGMEPIVIDKPCESLDILPTLSNLFGLEYDSRLLMGSDILSDTDPLVIFSNRSWITDRAWYNAAENKATFVDGTQEDKDYIKKINKIIAYKFKYSAKILETDYYSKVLP